MPANYIEPELGVNIVPNDVTPYFAKGCKNHWNGSIFCHFRTLDDLFASTPVHHRSRSSGRDSLAYSYFPGGAQTRISAQPAWNFDLTPSGEFASSVEMNN